MSRVAEQPVFRTDEGVQRRILRDDRLNGVEIAINEYAPETGSAPVPVHHEGYEYGIVLDGELTVELDGKTHKLKSGDLISYDFGARAPDLELCRPKSARALDQPPARRMKPAAFEYYAPRSLEEALALLAEHGGDGRVLAGGQSLVPAMNFRLARPAVLIDINRIDGAVRRQRERRRAHDRHADAPRGLRGAGHERDPSGGFCPRSRTTSRTCRSGCAAHLAGSLAHADPAAEWCTLALALDARIVARSTRGSRTIAAADFFRTIFTTDLHEGEMITEIHLPMLDERWRCGFVEFNRRAGDFAIVSAVTALRVEAGRIREARIALGGVVDKPVRAEAAEKALIGEARRTRRPFAPRVIVASRSFEPFGDIHATAEYKAELVAVMTRRALTRAMTE